MYAHGHRQVAYIDQQNEWVNWSNLSKKSSALIARECLIIRCKIVQLQVNERFVQEDIEKGWQYLNSIAGSGTAAEAELVNKN